MSFDELAKYHSLSLMKWDEDFYASENTQLAKAFYEAGQRTKQQEIDELKRLISDAIKGIEIELRYTTSMGHEQAAKAYQNSLDSLIQCKSFK